MHGNIFFFFWNFIDRLNMKNDCVFPRIYSVFFLCQIYVIIFLKYKKNSFSLKRFVYWHQFKLNLIAIRRIAKPKNCHRNIHHHHHTMFKHFKSFFFIFSFFSSKYHLYEYYLFIFRFPLVRSRREYTVNKCWYQTNWSGWTQHDHILYIFTLFHFIYFEISRLCDIIVMCEISIFRCYI